MVQHVFVCRICGYAYASKELAEKCEAYCNTHNSCSLEITSKAIGMLPVRGST